MRYGRVTLQQAAKYLHLTEKEVQGLVGHGALPGRRMKDGWGFTKEDLDDWLAAHMHALAEAHLRRLQSPGPAASTDATSFRLVGDLLREETIELGLKARTAASVLRQLCKVAERTWLVYDPAALLAALREREELCSTALPGGFALPHPRTRMPHLLGDSLVVFARAAQPVPFGAPHGEMTDLFFLILGTSDVVHLRALARLNLILRDDGSRAELRQVATAADALDLLARLDAQGA